MRKLITGATTGIATFLAMATPVLAQTYDRFDEYYDYDYDALFDATAGSAAAASSFAGMSILWVCCILIFALAVPTALAIFVYKDAEKNKVDNPIVWALITFFFNVIGLLIYFLAIRPDAIKEHEAKAAKKEDSPKASKEKEEDDEE